MISKIYFISLTALTLLTLSACGGGSSSSSAADVTQECLNIESRGGGQIYRNVCNFAVTGFFRNNQNASGTLGTVEANNVILLSRPPEVITELRLCRAPSRASGSGCS